MRVLTVQSEDLDTSKIVYSNVDYCNYPHALPVYKKLFEDYNTLKGTSYNSFFWGFSDLLTDDLDLAISRATSMLGAVNGKIYILEVPNHLCLETDFYNFSDEIYAYEFPDELESNWDSIYSTRKSEKQVIFPYIEPSMVIREI